VLGAKRGVQRTSSASSFESQQIRFKAAAPRLIQIYEFARSLGRKRKGCRAEGVIKGNTQHCGRTKLFPAAVASFREPNFFLQPRVKANYIAGRLLFNALAKTLFPPQISEQKKVYAIYFYGTNMRASFAV